MNTPRVTPRPPGATPPRAQTAAAIIATAGLVLLVAACGGSASPSGSGSSTNPKTSTSRTSASRPSASRPSALAFARCERSHGVPSYPDPGGSDAMQGSGLPKIGPQRLGVTDSQFQAANRACQRLLPANVQPTSAVSQQMLGKMWNFARCMRSHRVPNWPDPIHQSVTAPPGAPPYMFNLADVQGIDLSAPQTKTAMRECQHLTGSPVPYSG